MSNQIRIRHFHSHEDRPDNKGQLLATLATEENADGLLTVAITRCTLSADTATRKGGREQAIERLERYQRVFGRRSEQASPDDVEECRDDGLRRLVFECSRPELIELIHSNPFAKRGCQYGRLPK